MYGRLYLRSAAHPAAAAVSRPRAHVRRGVSAQPIAVKAEREMLNDECRTNASEASGRCNQHSEFSVLPLSGHQLASSCNRAVATVIGSSENNPVACFAVAFTGVVNVALTGLL